MIYNSVRKSGCHTVKNFVMEANINISAFFHQVQKFFLNDITFNIFKVFQMVG
jgi:hypothetical protein